MAPLTHSEVVEVARIEWEKQPAAFRQRAAQFLEDLAASNGGEIGVEELLSSGLVNVNGMGSRKFVSRIFSALDEERRGRLSVDRCIAVYYLCLQSSRRSCHSCRDPILPGLAFSCLTCASSSSSPSSPSSPPFALCLSCLSKSPSLVHHHPHPLLHDYAAFDQLLLRRASPPPSAAASPPPVRASREPEPAQGMKQCVVCGDFHQVEANGFMVGYHMAKKRGTTTDEFVCEWCFAYFCCRCGRRIRDSTTNAEPAKWLQKFRCGDCNTNRNVEDAFEDFIMQMGTELRTAEIIRQCRTCFIKHRNGSLFWSVDMRTQLTPRHARPSLAHQPTPSYGRPSTVLPPRQPPPPFYRPQPPPASADPQPPFLSPAAAASRPIMRPFAAASRRTPVARDMAPPPSRSMEVRPWGSSDSGDVPGSFFDDTRSSRRSSGSFHRDGDSGSSSDDSSVASSERRRSSGPPPAVGPRRPPGRGRGGYPGWSPAAGVGDSGLTRPSGGIRVAAAGDASFAADEGAASGRWSSSSSDSGVGRDFSAVDDGPRGPAGRGRDSAGYGDDFAPYEDDGSAGFGGGGRGRGGPGYYVAGGGGGGPGQGGPPDYRANNDPNNGGAVDINVVAVSFEENNYFGGGGGGGFDNSYGGGDINVVAMSFEDNVYYGGGGGGGGGDLFIIDGGGGGGGDDNLSINFDLSLN